MMKVMCGVVALGIALAVSQNASASVGQQSFCDTHSAKKFSIKLRSCSLDVEAQNSGSSLVPGQPGGDVPGPGRRPGTKSPSPNPNIKGPKDKNLGPNK